uniref:Serine/threonine-protein kinase n=1 Tax=Ascaris suum TaxID=6253 RepID=F1LAA4_ASCSU
MNKIPGQTNTFALKTETIDEDRKYLNRLKIEMTVLRLCSKLPPYRREHFIMLADKGRTEDFKFIVMELVGSSLDIIQREMPHHSFSYGTSTKVGLQTIDAISDLHEIGYIHRDVKPQNFSVGLKDKASTIYLLDFGIARKYTIKNTKAVRFVLVFSCQRRPNRISNS